MVFNPVLFRLSHCGSPASSRKAPQGFWETFGYGIIGRLFLYYIKKTLNLCKEIEEENETETEKKRERKRGVE